MQMILIDVSQILSLKVCFIFIYANLKKLNYLQKRNIYVNMFAKSRRPVVYDKEWIDEMQERFLKGTQNRIIKSDLYPSGYGYITAMAYSNDGSVLVIAFFTGLLQLRRGSDGEILRMMRTVMFPAYPIFCLKFHPKDKNICFAGCTDGIVYKIRIPRVIRPLSPDLRHGPVIVAATGARYVEPVFFDTSSISREVSSFVPGDEEVLSMAILASDKKMLTGCGTGEIRVIDLDRGKTVRIFKKRTENMMTLEEKTIRNRRNHSQAVCAVKEDPSDNGVFYTGSYDQSMKVWDIRCPMAMQKTFVGVNPCSDSIDVQKSYVICGNWLPTRGYSLFDMRTSSCVSTGGIQNRQRDIDGEYTYACRFWKAYHVPRAKYAILGGSGTRALEIVNVHNRYITASYPVVGSILTIATYENNIAFGGTYPQFNLVTFHDPKSEPEAYAPIIEDIDSIESEIEEIPPKPIFSFLRSDTLTDDDERRLCECGDICSCDGEHVCLCGELCSCEGLRYERSSGVCECTEVCSCENFKRFNADQSPSKEDSQLTLKVSYFNDAAQTETAEMSTVSVSDVNEESCTIDDISKSVHLKWKRLLCKCSPRETRSEPDAFKKHALRATSGSSEKLPYLTEDYNRQVKMEKDFDNVKKIMGKIGRLISVKQELKVKSYPCPCPCEVDAKSLSSVDEKVLDLRSSEHSSSRSRDG